MSQAVELALIGLAVVIVQSIFGYLSQRAHAETKEGIGQIKIATNGLAEKLAASQKEVGRDEGHEQGLAEGRAEK